MRAMPPAVIATLSDPTGHVPLAVSVVGVVVILVVALVALLVLSGWIAGRRHDAGRRDVVADHIRSANAALAAAHAADEGWDPAVLHAAARDAAVRAGVTDPSAVELVLVSVDDRPGVDDDRAVFTVRDGEREIELVLGREAGAWAPVTPAAAPRG
jgi:hypothetical protein